MKTGIAFFVLTLLLISSTAFSQEGWAEDYLIAHFNEGLVPTGDGYSNFDCFYLPNSQILITFVEHSSSATGDILTIKKSFDDGLTWTSANSTISGGVNTLFSPSIAPIPDSDTLLAVIITDYNTSTPNVIDTYRYTYNNHIYYQGWTQADYSYPGAGEPVSAFVINNEISGEVWIFSTSDNNWLYLTISSDGITWSPSTPVAANVSRPSAVVSSDGHVAVTWVNPVTENVMCTVSDASANFQPALIVAENSAPLASPVPGWEHIGDHDLGIVWHDNSGQSHINISDDQGSSWGESQYIGEGIYPNIDSFAGTRRMGVCYTTSQGDVKVASAVSIDAVPGITYTTRSHHEAYANGPSRVAYGEESGDLALFFLSPSSEDLWVTSSLFLTGIEGSEGSSPVAVFAGPNPGSGSFSLSTTGFAGSVQYSIYSLDGRLIQQSSPVNSNFVVNGGSYPAGVYTVVATGDGENASCRLVRL